MVKPKSGKSLWGWRNESQRDVCGGKPFIHYRFMSISCVLGLLDSRGMAFNKIDMVPTFTVQGN